MTDELITIRLEDLRLLYDTHVKSPRHWAAFRRAVIEAAVVKVDDGQGHPEWPKPNGDGPTYV